MLYKVITVSAAVFVGVSLQGCSNDDSTACDFTGIDETDQAAVDAQGDKCNKCLTDNGGVDLTTADPTVMANCDTMTKTLDAMTTCGAAGGMADTTKALFEVAKTAACASS